MIMQHKMIVKLEATYCLGKIFFEELTQNYFRSIDKAASSERLTRVPFNLLEILH